MENDQSFDFKSFSFFQNLKDSSTKYIFTKWIRNKTSEENSQTFAKKIIDFQRFIEIDSRSIYRSFHM